MTANSASRHKPRGARRDDVASAATPAWTDVLVMELSRRFAAMVDDMRQHAGTAPGLKGMLITDGEVDGLLARAQRRAAPQFTAGSMIGRVLDEAGESAAHLRGLQQRFALDGFEMDCLLVCLAGEIAPWLERVFGYLNDVVSARLPDADTLMRTVAPGQLPLQAQLGRDARLQRYGLLMSTGDTRFGPYRVAEGVVRYALAQDGLDTLLARAWCDADRPPLATLLWETRPEIDSLEQLLRSQFNEGNAARTPLVVGLRGQAGSGRQYLVEGACGRLGIGCIALDARKLKDTETLQRTLTAALRESVLLGAAVLLQHADAWLADPQLRADARDHLQPLLRELGWILVFASEADLNLASWFPAARVVDMPLAPLTVAARAGAWNLALAHIPCPESPRAALAAELGAKFRLTHGDIALAVQRVASVGAWPSTDAEWSDLLHRSAGSVAAPRLGQLAHALTVRHSLDDLVLPADRMAALHDIVRRVRHRSRVLEQWGLEAVSNRGRGLIALFHGASGTGKTMAAEAIAGTLRMQLFRIDLAGVVSKYIGETEKNLRDIFEEADRADAVLFFDEADALFGRRSEVKDAHDRYANIEINYLLQRIELFEGIAVLATNMRTHIDEAFLRRIHVTVEFPLPAESERLGLWDRSFPTAAPLANDIDWQFLAQRFELTGGAIRNAALGAAFLAADAGATIGMRQVINALRTELVKSGKRIADSEFGPYARHLSVTAAAPRRTRLRAAALSS
jgi:hypothetical protein